MQLTRGRSDVMRTVDNRFQYLDSSGLTEDVILLGQIDGRVPTEFDTVLNVVQHKILHRLKFAKKFALMMLKHKSVPAFSLCSTFP